MKKLLGLTFLLCCFVLSNLHAQIIDLIKPYDYGKYPIYKTVDADGNKYMVEGDGDYEDYTNSLLKYDKNNVLIWKAKLTDRNYNYGGVCTIDGDGNIVVVSPINDYQFFGVWKFTPSGNIIFETFAEVKANGSLIFSDNLRLDKNNNIYIAGNMYGGYQFGHFSMQSQALEPGDGLRYYGQPFLVKLNTQGQFQWGKSISCTDPYSTYLYGLTTDKFGNVFIGGDFYRSDLHIENETLSNHTELNDLFIVKYDSLGALKFVFKVGSPGGEDGGGGLSSDNNGGVYLDGTTDVPFTLNNWIVPKFFMIKFSQDTLEHPISYRINTGGPEISAPGKNWEKDYQLERSIFLDPSSSNHTTGSFYSWKGINNTGAPNTIFGSNRYDWPMGGEMFYNFPVANGIYKLSLFFAEKKLGVSSPGQRIFSVDVEGKRVLTDYDIFASAGLNADVRNFYVKVEDGILDIDFIRNIGNPQVNGIEIVSLDESTATAASVDEGSVPVLMEASRFSLTGRDQDVLLISAKDEDVFPATFKVYDAQGKLVYNESLIASDGLFKIDTKLFSEDNLQGLYLININNEETLKVIK